MSEKNERSAEPFVVAIDGHSAAGKSTFAKRLATMTDAVLVQGDHFYRVMDPGRRSQLSPPQGADLDYDWQRLGLRKWGFGRVRVQA